MISLAREELRGTEHLSPSRLIAYHRGEVPPTEATPITEHLSLCRECSALALEVAEFFADDDEEEDINPTDSEAAWQELQAVMSGAEQRPKAPSPVLSLSSFAPPHRSLLRSLAFAYSVAAACAAVSVGLILFRETTPHRSPQANTGLYDLTSSGSNRAEAADATPIRFRTPGDSALLILNPEGTLDSARYGVRIRDSKGAVVWRSEELVVQAPGGFHLSLPAGALPPGHYSLELYGTTERRETPLGTYPIIVIEK
jgi:hypothetical protein